MALDPVDLLLDELIADGKWPPRREVLVHQAVRTYRSFLTSDRDELRHIAGWSSGRDYKVDPLAELIADAWADHLYADELEVSPAAEGDAGAAELVLEGNEDLLGDLHSAARDVVGEGEKWWRVYVDTDVADVPLLDWHSRDVVIPLYVGRRLLAAAVVTELGQQGAKSVRWRHFEIHVDGYVEHVLFKGTARRIGATVPLETHKELLELAAGLPGAGTLEPRRWAHTLPMLMGRVGNGRRYNRELRAGVSDFERISDYLLDLNEAATIGAENMRLTAKRRILLPEEALVPRRPELEDDGAGGLIPVGRRANGGAEFDAGEDVLVVSKLDAELGKAGEAPYKVLEYAFDADALIAWKRDLVETALTRVGLTPLYVGVSTGEAIGVLSGTAYKLKLIPTTKAGKGKARPHDDAAPRFLSLLFRLDALDTALGGFGRSWTDPTSPPAVERPGALPVDDVEEAQTDATLVNARLRSRFTSVQRQHPEWTEAQVKEELERIDEDQPAGSAAGAFGLA